ncbi:MAG: hypothetical protein Q8P68_05950 [Candidatus Peregrinibacteria bacterium]|nr:hypothetical protein [Candidatus Peregrinibacteria bacterium]
MKTLKSHVLQVSLVLTGVLALGFMDKSLVSLAIYSVAILLGAMIIAWAAEASEVVISQGLALAIVAWLQVFPEFMIEATIAWSKDVPNMLANFTGANRILTGVGWPLVFFVTMFFHHKKTGKFIKEIQLENEHSAEIVFFMVATIYSIWIYMQGKLTIFDAFVMISIYVTYLYFVSKLPHLSRKKSEKMVMGIPKKIISLKKQYIKPVILVCFLIGGFLIYFTADRFYNEALALATTLGVSQFLFIQWVAPFLSEFPEKTSAFYWASKVTQAPMALMNLISSKLTQWTMLMAMIPIVYSISVGHIAFIPLTTEVTNTTSTTGMELLLTIGSSLYASVFLLKLRFMWFEAASLFLLWLVQFIWVDSREIITWLYFILAACELIVFRKEIHKAFSGFKTIFHSHVKTIPSSS